MFDLVWKHPLIVHVPLVLIPIAVLFAVIDFVLPHYRLRYVALVLLAFGVAGAVFAAASGEEAQHAAERLMPTVESLQVAGTVPRTVASGSLLETHAKLGEMTRNVYLLLLVAECGLLFMTEPIFARFRRGWTLQTRIARVGRGLWLVAAMAGLVLVVLTGHYGGTLVYNHGVGVAHSAGSSQTP